MIKKYNQYIKEDIDYSNIDPWGEEYWLNFSSMMLKNLNGVVLD